MSAFRITINTDDFHDNNRDARRAVAKTLRALAKEMEKGDYIGSFCLPMRDTSNWTAEQCLQSFKGTHYEHADDTAALDLDGLRARAQFTHPDGLWGDVDEL